MTPAAGASGTGGTWGIKVLIIEDGPNIVDLIRSNLVVRGFNTVVSAGARVPPTCT